MSFAWHFGYLSGVIYVFKSEIKEKNNQKQKRKNAVYGEIDRKNLARTQK